MEALVKQELQKLLSGKLTCPSDIKGLNKIIELKNKLTKQLNNLYTQIDSINKIIDPINEFIPPTETAIKIAKTSIDALSFIPSTAVTPIPVGPILTGLKAIDVLQGLINKGKDKLGVATSAVSSLINNLQKVIDLLEMIDMVIGSCAKELNGTLNKQEQLSNQLLKSTQQQSQQLSPVITNFNGFKMDVITLTDQSINGLERRQATAKNSQGIIMLKGDPSFSSNDQILIDELVFYIKQNDLKAD